MPRAREQHANAAGAKAERRGNLAMVRPFDMGKPHELSFPWLQARKGATDIEAGRGVAPGRAGLGNLGARLVLVLPPVVDDEIAGDAEDVGAQLLLVMRRQWPAEEPKVGLL